MCGDEEEFENQNKNETAAKIEWKKNVFVIAINRECQVVSISEKMKKKDQLEKR